MTREDMLALADRVESLTGPDREVDARIQNSVFGWHKWASDTPWIASDEGLPAYTASLDAAMSLASDPTLEQFGGSLGILRWAMDMLERAKADAPALPRYVTAAALRARAEVMK
jgi:hypothetical protein